MVGHGGTAVRVVACGLAWRARDVTGMRRKLRGGWPRGWPRDHGRRQDALPASHEQEGETDVGRCMMTVSGTRTERMDPVDVAYASTLTSLSPTPEPQQNDAGSTSQEQGPGMRWCPAVSSAWSNPHGPHPVCTRRRRSGTGLGGGYGSLAGSGPRRRWPASAACASRSAPAAARLGPPPGAAPLVPGSASVRDQGPWPAGPDSPCFPDRRRRWWTGI